MPKQPGFSLIELMIVVAIIGILAMMALPSYQNYTRKARFAEVISMTETYKIAIALALQEGIPADELYNNNHGIPAPPNPTRNVANIEVENGIITATATALANNATYILKPNTDGSSWAINGSCIKLGYCHV